MFVVIQIQALAVFRFRYGYIKNHKKTVKNGQARTQERKSEQKPEAKARKSQIFSQQKSTTKDKTQNVPFKALNFPKVKTKGYSKLKVKDDNSDALQHNGRVNYVKSRAIIDHLSIKATWLWKKAQGKVDFTFGSLRDVAQAITSRMTAWQSLSVHT
ncbi:hypothetical protein Tco_1350108 [Tanacetum coccineum]